MMMRVSVSFVAIATLLTSLCSQAGEINPSNLLSSSPALSKLVKDAVGSTLVAQEGDQIAVLWRDTYGNKSPSHLYLGSIDGKGSTNWHFSHGTPRALTLQNGKVIAISTVETHDGTSEVRIADNQSHLVTGLTLPLNGNTFGFTSDGHAFVVHHDANADKRYEEHNGHFEAVEVAQ